MQIYINISNDLSLGIWKTSHFFQSIGYPLVLAFLRGQVENFSTLMGLFQAFISSMTLIIFYRTVNEGLGKKVALVALFIGAIHVPWILFSNYALPETLFTFFISLCAWFSLKLLKSNHPNAFDGALWGLCFICAFWLKSTHAFFGPLFLISLFVLKRKLALRAIAVICLVVGIGLSLHAVLTYSTIGKAQFSASAGGINFIEGKCPHKINTDSTGISWQSPLYYQLEMNAKKIWSEPFTNSSFYLMEGLKCIQNDPLVLIQSFESIPYLFMGNTTWPINRKAGANYVRLYELFFGIFLIFGIISFAIQGYEKKISKSDLLLWITPIASIFICVYIFKSEMRFRIPFDLWFIPVAVKGWLIRS